MIEDDQKVSVWPLSLLCASSSSVSSLSGNSVDEISKSPGFSGIVSNFSGLFEFELELERFGSEKSNGSSVESSEFSELLDEPELEPGFEFESELEPESLLSISSL